MMAIFRHPAPGTFENPLLCLGNLKGRMHMMTMGGYLQKRG